VPLQLADLLAYLLRRKTTGAPDGLWREIYDHFFSDVKDI